MKRYYISNHKLLRISKRDPLVLICLVWDEYHMKKIMIVDDEQDFREMVNLMIQKEGFETEMAEDGTDFLNKIDRFQPDLVTLDVMMPGLSAFEILDKLKEKESKPKIILLTSIRYTDKEIDRLFNTWNVVDYIVKPFDYDDLLKRLHKHINIIKMQKNP